MLDVLVTIPAYNEEDTIVKVINEVNDALKKYEHEIVVVSDGSTDNTVKLAQAAGAIVVTKEHSGLADTFNWEIDVAVIKMARLIAHIDADGQYSAYDLPKMIDAARKYDLVLGNRMAGRIEYMPFTKRLFNFLGAIFFSFFFLRQMVWDVTTGLRVFNMKVARLRLYSDHTYTVEQLIKAKRAKATIVSLPVSFYRRDGESRLIPSSFNYIWRTIKNFNRMMK